MNGRPDHAVLLGWCSDARSGEVAWAPVRDSLATGGVARLAASELALL